MNHLDLFSGIGGFSLGLKKVFDIKHTYYSEIDKYAIDVYKNNFKNITYVKSVTNVRGGELPRIDIITFGSPCQDFSLAGKRKGMDGARSSLITQAIRLIKECRPSFFIWENVKGTFSSNSGSDFWAIIQAFTNIGGYRLEWQLLNTKWFLPQNRERIYLVGCLGKGSGQQVFPIPENNQRNNKKQLSRKKTNKHKCSLPHTKGRRRYSVFSNTKKGYEIAKEGDTINYQNLPSKTRRGRVGKGIAQTLDSGGEQAVVKPTQIGNSKKFGNAVGKDNQDAFTLRSANPNGVILNQSIRRLTPIECERLQGFPDDWTKIGKELGTISDSQRYKMCGNAVTVDVVEAVAKNIKKVLPTKIN
jgi:DNA (cytosine-5)-methyltransferase 1